MWEVNLRSILRSNEVNSEVKFSKTGLKLSKTGAKLSKTGAKPSEKTQSNGRVNLNILYLPAWDPETGCVLPPLGSPTGSQKRSYVTAPGAVLGRR